MSHVQRFALYHSFKLCQGVSINICRLLATSGGIRTHGGPSIAHDGTQVPLVMSPIDQTLAQHPLSPTRLGTDPSFVVSRTLRCWCNSAQSPCVLAPGAFHPDSLSGLTLLVWWLVLIPSFWRFPTTLKGIGPQVGNGSINRIPCTSVCAFTNTAGDCPCL